MEELKAICGIVRDLGFPIFVASWLLIRTDRRLKDIVEAIREHNKK